MLRLARAIVATSLLVPIAAQVTVAESSSPDPGAALSRVDVPEAGISLAFPEGLSVNVVMEREEVDLPPEAAESGPVYVWVVLSALAPDGHGCQLGMYESYPLTLEEHAEWIGQQADDVGFAGTVESTHVSLPAGDAIRIDLEDAEQGFYGTAYLMESHAARYQLRCFDFAPAEDDWLSVAETVEYLPMSDEETVDAPTAALGKGADLVRDFRTQVAVVDPSTVGFPEASLMNADCAFALRIEAKDGSATEWLACTLSDDPVDPPAYQGVPPSTAITISGGECVWESDYWSIGTGRMVAASEFEITVTPTGQVFGRSSYPAEPLDCSGT